MDEDRGRRFGIWKILSFAAGLVLVALIVLPFVIDANQFRPVIESKLTAALGREVKIGNLRFSLLGGSIDADAVSIADDRNFSAEPFVRARSLHIGVELWPLIFSRAVKITSVSLAGPDIRLIRAATGKWNFSSLGGGAETAPATQPDDSGNQSAAMDMSVRLLNVTGGRVTVIRAGENHKPYLSENVNLKVQDLSSVSVFPFMLTASTPGGGGVKLEGKVGPLKAADLIGTPMEAAFGLTHLDLAAAGIVDPAAGLGGIVDLQSNLISDGRQAKVRGHASVDRLQLVKGGAPAGRPVSLEYSLLYDLRNQSGSLDDTKVTCGQAVANLQGTFAVRNDAVVLNMRLRGEKMPAQDLQALLPAAGVILPRGALLQGGTLSLAANSEGPVEKMVTTATVDLSGTRLTGYDLGAKLSAVASLAGIHAGPSTDIERLSADLKMTPQGIQVDRFTLFAPSLGQMSGDGVVGADHALDFKMLVNLNASAGVAGQLARFTGGSSLAVPFFIRGTTEDPRFIPDTKGVAESLLNSATGREGKPAASPLGKALNDLFGRKKKQD